ncbi:hypothetical protein [uncultured Cocleimonas sp.]|uniref:hypothetical protein n=1 Tax=uncultured Cocleimonas sp. TaxID=1051587 RepID=UPI002630887F|nr:hypothetical protein [uncultured Cocleimonas sp.]
MNKFKEQLINQYLVPQNKKWLRVMDSISVVFCFVCALVALYYLYYVIEQNKKLSFSLTIVSWAYVVTLVPIFFVLYKESLLKKYERLAIVFFVLFSGSSLLFSIMQLHIKT